VETELKASNGTIIKMKQEFQTKFCEYYFTNRVVNAWNSLPYHIVLSEAVTLLNHDLINIGMQVHMNASCRG